MCVPDTSLSLFASHKLKLNKCEGQAWGLHRLYANFASALLLLNKIALRDRYFTYRYFTYSVVGLKVYTVVGY